MWYRCLNHATINRTAQQRARSDFILQNTFFKYLYVTAVFPVLLFIFLAVKNSQRHKHPPEETRPVKSHVVHTARQTGTFLLAFLTRIICNHEKFYFPTISDCCFWIERIKTFLKVNKHTFTSVYTVYISSGSTYTLLMCKSVHKKQILYMKIGNFCKKKQKVKQNKNIVRPVSFDER